MDQKVVLGPTQHPLARSVRRSDGARGGGVPV